jgi:hypothetical protein
MTSGGGSGGLGPATAATTIPEKANAAAQHGANEVFMSIVF